mgnify:CR=1 FL=1
MINAVHHKITVKISSGGVCKTNTGKKIASNKVALFDARSCLTEFFTKCLNLFSILIIDQIGLCLGKSIKSKKII